MTDEEIIIDGVDVSGCEFYRCGVEDCCELGLNDDIGATQYNLKCSQNPDCFFKQLQRTKAQYNAVVEHNKYLQSELLITRSKVNRKTYDIHKINAELKKLKQKLSKIAQHCNKVFNGPESLVQVLLKIERIAQEE